MNRFLKGIHRMEMAVAKYTLALLSFLVFASAVARTLHHPLGWAMDAATFLFAWCVFLGGDIAIREDRLFCIVLLTAKLPQKIQVYIKVVNCLIIALFLLGMIGYGSWLTYTTRLRAFQGIPGFSYAWVTVSVPIGCLLMLLSISRKIKELLQSAKEGTPPPKDQCATEII